VAITAQIERYITAQRVMRSFLRRRKRLIETMRQTFYRVYREYKFDLA
jgi:hypothetical protein